MAGWLWLGHLSSYLLHKPSEDNPDDRYQFEFKTQSEVAAADSTKYLWFRVNDILKFSNGDEAIEDYCKAKDYDRAQERIITRLYKVIAEEFNVNYFEEMEKSLDKVLKIFIRVNSGGMQLSYSDLLMSLLTATFKSEIRENMENFVDSLRDQGFGCIGRDQVLKTCLMLTDSNHIFKLSNFSKSNIRKIEDKWNLITEYILVTVKFLASLGYKDQLSSGYIASVVAYYLYKRSEQKPSSGDRNAISMFVKLAQIRGFFSAGLDGKLTRTKDLLDTSSDFSDFLNKTYAEFEGFKVSPSDVEWFVENVQYGASSMLPLLQLLYPNLNYSTTVFHIDHIYPKSKFVGTTAGLPDNYIGRQNYLFNLQLLEGVANEEKRAKDPEVWLKSQYADQKKREKYLSDNFIPKDFVLDWDKLPQFETDRKALLKVRLLEAFGIDDKKLEAKAIATLEDSTLDAPGDLF